MSKKTRVVFLRQHGPYVKGDIAGFDAEAIRRLKAMKLPVIAECDEEGNPLDDGDAAKKAALLEEIAGREGIALEQTIAIGDGANDLPVLSRAGLGVAYHAKPLVKESASHAISNFGLDSVLYLMGFSDRDIRQAGFD